MKRSTAMPEMTRERARKWVRRFGPWRVEVLVDGTLVVRSEVAMQKAPGLVERLELGRAVGKLIDECGAQK